MCFNNSVLKGGNGERREGVSLFVYHWVLNAGLPEVGYKSSKNLYFKKKKTTKKEVKQVLQSKEKLQRWEAAPEAPLGFDITTR